jgi:hypothetical protein
MAEPFLLFDSRAYSDDCRALADGYRRLPKALARKHIKAAVNRAVKPFVPALRAATPKGKPKRSARVAAAAARAAGKKLPPNVNRPGRLRRSIVTVTKFTNKVDHGSFVSRVTFRRGEGKGNHALWVEAGTAARKAGKSGANRGAVSPRWFLRSLFLSMAPGIASSMSLHLAAGLEAAARELPKYLEKRRR